MFMISPSAGLLSLVDKYGKALNFTMDRLKKKPEKEIVKQVHQVSQAVPRQIIFDAVSPPPTLDRMAGS
jgi:hypothetical protein